MARAADVPLPAVKYGAAPRIKVYSTQAVRLRKLEKIMYYYTMAVV